MPAVGQHDRRHQRVQQTRSAAPAGVLDQPRVDHTERRADDALRRQRRQAPRPPSHPRGPRRSRPASSSSTSARRCQDPRARAERLDKHQPPQRRLPIQKPSSAPSPARIRAAHSRSPSHAGTTTAASSLDRVVKRREEAVFTVAEQVIERLVRHTRPVRRHAAPSSADSPAPRQPRTSHPTTACAATQRHTTHHHADPAYPGRRIRTRPEPARRPSAPTPRQRTHAHENDERRGHSRGENQLEAEIRRRFRRRN